MSKKKQEDEIRKRFKSAAFANPQLDDDVQGVADEFAGFAVAVTGMVPDNRERAIAITHLQEAFNSCRAAIEAEYLS